MDTAERLSDSAPARVHTLPSSSTVRARHPGGRGWSDNPPRLTRHTLRTHGDLVKSLLAAAIRDALVPVTHMLKIEAAN